MVNEQVGEIEILVAGEVIPLRPSFKGIQQIQQLCGGKSIYWVSIQLSQPATQLIEYVVAVTWGGYLGYCQSEGKEPKWTYETLGDFIVQHGQAPFLDQIAKFLQKGLVGSEKKMAPEKV